MRHFKCIVSAEFVAGEALLPIGPGQAGPFANVSHSNFPFLFIILTQELYGSGRTDRRTGIAVLLAV